MTTFSGGRGYFWNHAASGWQPARHPTVQSRGSEATEAELEALRAGVLVIEGDAFVYPPRALPAPGLRPAQEEDW